MEIVSEAGVRIPVESNQLSGALDLVIPSSKSSQFLGWAADFKTAKPVRIVLFLDGQARYFASTRHKRPDVARF